MPHGPFQVEMDDNETRTVKSRGTGADSANGLVVAHDIEEMPGKGTPTADVPGSAILVAAKDANGKVQFLEIDPDGQLKVVLQNALTFESLQATLQAGSAVVGAVKDAGYQGTVSQVAVQSSDATGAGMTVAVASAAGKRYRIVDMYVSASASVKVTLQSGAAAVIGYARIPAGNSVPLTFRRSLESPTAASALILVASGVCDIEVTATLEEI